MTRVTRVDISHEDQAERGKNLFKNDKPDTNEKQAKNFFDLNQDCLVKWAEMYPTEMSHPSLVSEFKQGVDKLKSEGVHLPDSKHLTIYHNLSSTPKKEYLSEPSIKELSRKSSTGIQVDIQDNPSTHVMIKKGLDKMVTLQHDISSLAAVKNEVFLGAITAAVKNSLDCYNEYKPYFQVVLRSNEPKYNVERKTICSEKNFVHEVRVELKKLEALEITFADFCDVVASLEVKANLNRKGEYGGTSGHSISVDERNHSFKWLDQRIERIDSIQPIFLSSQKGILNNNKDILDAVPTSEYKTRPRVDMEKGEYSLKFISPPIHRTTTVNNDSELKGPEISNFNNALTAKGNQPTEPDTVYFEKIGDRQDTLNIDNRHNVHRHLSHKPTGSFHAPPATASYEEIEKESFQRDQRHESMSKQNNNFVAPVEIEGPSIPILNKKLQQSHSWKIESPREENHKETLKRDKVITIPIHESSAVLTASEQLSHSNDRSNKKPNHSTNNYLQPIVTFSLQQPKPDVEFEYPVDNEANHNPPHNVESSINEGAEPLAAAAGNYKEKRPTQIRPTTNIFEGVLRFNSQSDPHETSRSEGADALESYRGMDIKREKVKVQGQDMPSPIGDRPPNPQLKESLVYIPSMTVMTEMQKSQLNPNVAVLKSQLGLQDNSKTFFKANMNFGGDSMNRSLFSGNNKASTPEVEKMVFDIKPCFGATKTFVLENKSDIDKLKKQAPQSIYDSSHATNTVVLSKAPTSKIPESKTLKDPTNSDEVVLNPAAKIKAMQPSTHTSDIGKVSISARSRSPDHPSRSQSPTHDKYRHSTNIAQIGLVTSHSIRPKHAAYNFALDESQLSPPSPSLAKNYKPQVLQSPQNIDGHSKLGSSYTWVPPIKMHTNSVIGSGPSSNPSPKMYPSNENVNKPILTKLPISKHARELEELISDGYQIPEVISFNHTTVKSTGTKEDETELKSARSHDIENAIEQIKQEEYIKNALFEDRNGGSIKKIHLNEDTQNIISSHLSLNKQKLSSVIKTPSWAPESDYGNRSQPPLGASMKLVSPSSGTEYYEPTESLFGRNTGNDQIFGDSILRKNVLCDSQIVQPSASKNEGKIFSFNFDNGSNELKHNKTSSNLGSMGAVTAGFGKSHSQGIFHSVKNSEPSGMNISKSNLEEKYEEELKRVRKLYDTMLTNLQSKLESVEVEKADYRKQLDRSEMSSSLKINEVMALAETEMKKLRKKNEELQYSVKTLQLSVSMQAIEHNRTAELETRNAHLTKEISRLNEEMTASFVKRIEVNQEEKDSQMMLFSNQLDIARKGFETTLHTLKERQQTERDRTLADHLDISKKLNSKIETLEAQVSDLRTKNSELKIQVSPIPLPTLEATSFHLLNLHPSKKSSHEEKSPLIIAKIEKLESELKKQRESQMKTQVDGEHLKQQLLIREDQLLEAEGYYHKLVREMDEVKNENLAKLKELYSKDKEIFDVNGKLAELTKKYTAILKTVEVYQSREVELKHDLEVYQARVHSLTELTTKYNPIENNQEREEELIQIREQIIYYQKKNEELMHENATLRRSYMEKDVDLSVASTAFATEQVFMKNLEKENVQLKQELFGLSKRILEYEDKHLSEELLRSTVEKCNQEVRVLKTLAKEQDTSRQALEYVLESKEDEILKLQSEIRGKLTLSVQTQTIGKEIDEIDKGRDKMTTSEVTTHNDKHQNRLDKLSVNHHTRSQPVFRQNNTSSSNNIYRDISIGNYNQYLQSDTLPTPKPISSGNSSLKSIERKLVNPENSEGVRYSPSKSQPSFPPHLPTQLQLISPPEPQLNGIRDYLSELQALQLSSDVKSLFKQACIWRSGLLVKHSLFELHLSRLIPSSNLKSVSITFTFVAEVPFILENIICMNYGNIDLTSSDAAAALIRNDNH